MPNRRISKYQKFFAAGDEYSQCRLCGKGVKRQTDGGTNTFRNHLSVHHKQQFVQFLSEQPRQKQPKDEDNTAEDIQRQYNELLLNSIGLPDQGELAAEIKMEDLSVDSFEQFLAGTAAPQRKATEYGRYVIWSDLWQWGQFQQGSRDHLKVPFVTMSIAIVQAGTVLYDTPATLDKLEKLAEEAASHGAKLLLFPEGFVGGYPKWNDFGIVLGTRSLEGREEYKRYFDSSIEEHGPESNRLTELAIRLEVHLVVGVIEKDGDTLYCSVFFYSPRGYLGKHRKILPTAMERCVWGCGDGSTMPVFETDVGKIGAAICWENYMPLYRVSLYSKGIQLYLAPTVDDREVWLSTMRTIALEGRCFVISACQFLMASDYPEDHPLRKKHGEDQVLIRGGSCAVDPLGTVLVEPDFSGEMIRYVNVDLSTITKGKFDLDCVGHYSRPDIFQLRVNEKEQRGVIRE